MINLIPPEGQKTLQTEYLLRVGSVYAFMLSGVLLAATALLIPANVLVNIQFSSLSSEMATKESDAAYTDADHTIRDANGIVAQLGLPRDTRKASDVINEVRGAASKDISFTTFQVIRDEGSITALQVQGVAISRQALSTFKDELEKKPDIASAEVPLSDLARESDLPFAIKVIFKK